MGNQPKTVTKMVNADSGLSTVIWAESVLTIPIKILARGGGRSTCICKEMVVEGVGEKSEWSKKGWT